MSDTVITEGASMMAQLADGIRSGSEGVEQAVRTSSKEERLRLLREENDRLEFDTTTTDRHMRSEALHKAISISTHATLPAEIVVTATMFLAFLRGAPASAAGQREGVAQ